MVSNKVHPEEEEPTDLQPAAVIEALETKVAFPLHTPHAQPSTAAKTALRNIPNASRNAGEAAFGAYASLHDAAHNEINVCLVRLQESRKHKIALRHNAEDEEDRSEEVDASEALKRRSIWEWEQGPLWNLHSRLEDWCSIHRTHIADAKVLEQLLGAYFLVVTLFVG